MLDPVDVPGAFSFYYCLHNRCNLLRAAAKGLALVAIYCPFLGHLEFAPCKKGSPNAKRATQILFIQPSGSNFFRLMHP